MFGNDSVIREKVKRRNIDFEGDKVDFEQISTLSDNSQKEENYIDDLTFSDLNLKEIFKKIDRTYTTPGQEALYHILRRPLINKMELENRQKIIKFFQQDEKAVEDISVQLYKLSKTTSNSKGILWYEYNDPMWLSIVSKITAVTPFIFLILAIVLWNGWFLGLLLLNSLINSLLNLQIEKILAGRDKIAGYLADTIRVGEKIADLNLEPLKEQSARLKELTYSCRKIKNSGKFLKNVKRFNELLDLINNIFVLEANFYFMLMRNLKDKKKELKELYYLIGEVDAYISIANFRKNHSDISDPVFTDGKYLKVEEIAHPLLKNPTTNSVLMDNKGILITGSNMSGKSTFLRTIGVNALLAQTILTTFTKEYMGSIFYITSSISPEDNIVEGKSYYLGEAEGILRIIKKSTLLIPTLCMIDEIFRGTNPVERISAAANISNYLIENNALPLIATHDLELTKMVKNFNFYYFREDVEDEGMVFDYKLREGISPTRNAIKLLKFLGYPDIIIDKIEDQIKSYK